MTEVVIRAGRPTWKAAAMSVLFAVVVATALGSPWGWGATEYVVAFVAVAAAGTVWFRALRRRGLTWTGVRLEPGWVRSASRVHGGKPFTIPLTRSRGWYWVDFIGEPAIVDTGSQVFAVAADTARGAEMADHVDEVAARKGPARLYGFGNDRAPVMRGAWVAGLTAGGHPVGDGHVLYIDVAHIPSLFGLCGFRERSVLFDPGSGLLTVDGPRPEWVDRTPDLRVQDGRLVGEADIGDQRLRVRIDTGAVRTVVGAHRFPMLGRSVSGGQGIQGPSAPRELVALPGYRLGGVELPAMEAQQVPGHQGVNLGLDVLGHRPLFIDGRRGEGWLGPRYPRKASNEP